ncbi:MAG: hypothetical protein ABJA69_04105 [Acidobacteriaceae bacterium]
MSEIDWNLHEEEIAARFEKIFGRKMTPVESKALFLYELLPKNKNNKPIS